MNGIWIRSQNRENLVFVNDIDVYLGCVSHLNGAKENAVLGTYGSNERALEVLEEIAQFINGYEKQETMFRGAPLYECTEEDLKSLYEREVQETKDNNQYRQKNGLAGQLEIELQRLNHNYQYWLRHLRAKSFYQYVGRKDKQIFEMPTK